MDVMEQQVHLRFIQRSLLRIVVLRFRRGNAPTERKMQRLFRRPEVTKLIKKCNDFGAGGVSVAIGELGRQVLR